MPLTRRHLLGWLSSSTFFLTAGPIRALEHRPGGLPALQFPQGVASGDPQPDGIMLWTRAVPDNPETRHVSLVLQLSETADFASVVLQETLQTDVDADFTVRAFVDGLKPNTHYFYRFSGGSETSSRVGRTRTAAAPGQDVPVNVAFASCQSYEQAHYGAWARLLEEDTIAPEDERIDFVLHLGDFIYERCWYEKIDGSPQSRRLPPFPDGVDTAKNRYAVSLADYRHLYKVYLSDPHLQAARAHWPFICTWDDHEFSNNGFQSYSTYGKDIKPDAARKQSANQAWFEYIPAVLGELRETDGEVEQPAHDFTPQPLPNEEQQANRAAIDSLCIYRRLSWGNHLDILLTDVRSYRSAPCLPDGLAASLGLPLPPVSLVAIADAGSAYNDGQPPATLPYGDGTTPNPNRDRPPGTMLGLAQRDWFLDTLASSKATWKLWGNAIPLVPMYLDMSEVPFAGYEDTLYNIDSWAGYPHEVSVIMDALADRGITGLVSLSGDHHLHAAGTVSRSTSDPDSKPVSADFSVTGISSSPVFGDLMAAAMADHGSFGSLVYRESGDELEPVWHISMLDGVMAALAYGRTGMQRVSQWLGPNNTNRGLQFMDTTHNGYGIARFGKEGVQVTLVGLQDCTEDFTEPPGIEYSAHFQLAPWEPGEDPDLKGPYFSGKPPFPYKTNAG